MTANITAGGTGGRDSQKVHQRAEDRAGHQARPMAWRAAKSGYAAPLPTKAAPAEIAATYNRATRQC